MYALESPPSGGTDYAQPCQWRAIVVPRCFCPRSVGGVRMLSKLLLVRTHVPYTGRAPAPDPYIAGAAAG